MSNFNGTVRTELFDICLALVTIPRLTYIIQETVQITVIIPVVIVIIPGMQLLLGLE